jgi:hypothetical protein
VRPGTPPGKLPRKAYPPLSINYRSQSDLAETARSHRVIAENQLLNQWLVAGR